MSQPQPCPALPHAPADSDPGRQIFLFENHDEALFVWRRAGVSSRILIHVDPHHDMGWNQPGASVTFANYICAALQEDLVREVYWVVPNASWATAGNRRQIVHQLREIVRAYHGSPRDLRIEKNRACARILGKPLEVCALSSVPAPAEPVLLDLDVDFLVLPRVGTMPAAEHPELPCCWPGELVAELEARNLRWDLATIAYSVEGGYTPLHWKYLGQELALRLAASGEDKERQDAMTQLRSGAESLHRGDTEGAAAAYRKAAALWPESAAPTLHLALLFQQRGNLEEAQRLHRGALERDPSCRTAYSSDGLWHYWDGRWQAAASEFRRAIELNPEDATSQVGLAWLAMRRKRWTEAEDLLRRAIGVEPGHLDAWRALGETLERQGRYREACAALERSLQLALAGGKSRRIPPPIYTGAPRLLDFDHWTVFANLGRLYQKQGDPAAARQRLSMALAGGYESLDLHWRLLWLGANDGRGHARRLWDCVKQLWGAGRKLLHPLLRCIERLYEAWMAW